VTQLQWHQGSQIRYESGVDRGVLYPQSGPGVAWNGLVSVNESVDGNDTTAFHFDGVKYLDTVSPSAYRATVNAFSAPREFGECIGERSVIPGFVITRQRRVRFGFSYRTLIGTGLGYKLHLVYNASATPESRSYATMNESASAETRSWRFDAVPELSSTHRPSAHFVIDSTKTNPAALANVESILYGSATRSPRLLNSSELIDFIAFWHPTLVVPAPVTGLLSLNTPGGDLTMTSMAGFYRAQANTRLTEVLPGLNHLVV
jgi:hypothetical protein